MTQSALQLLAAQQTANTQLQIQAQQSHAAQLVHTNTLKALAMSIQQRNFGHIFSSIPIFDSTKREDFFQMGQNAGIQLPTKC